MFISCLLVEVIFCKINHSNELWCLIPSGGRLTRLPRYLHTESWSISNPCLEQVAHEPSQQFELACSADTDTDIGGLVSSAEQVGAGETRGKEPSRSRELKDMN